MDYIVAQPLVSIKVEGDRFRAVVSFPSGPINGRRSVIGPVMATVQDAVTAALGQAVPVIVDIVTPREYPDIDD